VKGFRRQHGAIAFASVVLARAASAGDASGGGLVGFVESTRGVPVAGAVVSLFGKGIRGGSLVTLTDSTGQFAMPSLPAGSYTLRAIGNGHEPAPARQITVLPNQESLFTVSLTPQGEEAPAAPVEPAVTVVAPREWQWLVKHRRRSVLEAEDESGPARAETTVVSVAPTVPASIADVMGTVEFLSAPVVLAQGVPEAGLESSANLGAVRLGGHFAGGGTWSLGGLLAETGNTSWRVAAEFLIEPAEGHQLEAGAGFGTRDLRMGASDLEPGGLDARSLGALFVRDTWSLSETVSASAGARYSFIGFVRNHNYVDPHADVAVRPDKHTVLRASLGSRTLAPGGDLLTLSTVASSPALALAQIDDEGRAERAWRAEVSADRAFGAQTTIGARAFREDVRDQLMSLYEGGADARLLRITNAGALYVSGVGVTVTRRFGKAVVGAVTYTLGHSERDGGPADVWATPVSYRSADFHDVVAQVETIIDLTDTRLTAYCRWNSLLPEVEGAEPHAFQTTRFDLQLTQGLPFLHELTRAEWEVLLSLRNLSYEAAEAGVLDELAVLRPPKRLMGGVAVRF